MLWHTAVLAWPLSFALYLAFAANIGIPELITAALAASIGSASLGWLVHCAELDLHLRFRDVLQIWRLPAYLVTGLGEVMVALAHQLFTREGAASVLATSPFDIGDLKDPAEAGRRALAVFYTTATPNFVVLGLINEQGTMLYHQVKPGKVLKITQNLGAQP